MINLVKYKEWCGENSKLKICKFPGCGVEFYGRGKTKYCEEHRKQQYKKILYCKYKDAGVGESNILIHHDKLIATKIVRQCALCNKNYEIMLIPNQFVYPNYCSEHRNEYKREYFNRGLCD